MTDLRALCARMADELDHYRQLVMDDRREVHSLAVEARAALAQPEPDVSQLSDGYHTFSELYEHRHALCLALMRAMPQHCWFSLRHADGERCFGGTDWFIFGAELPGVGSVTYHLPAELYPIAQATGATDLPKGRPWDGHTAADVVSRLREWAALAQPVSQGPTDKELLNLMPETMRDEFSYAAKVCSDATGGQVKPDIFRVTLNTAALEYARAVLARWGRPAIEPVPQQEAE